MTCMEMCGNGVGIGMVVIVEMRQIQWDHRQARSACAVAAVGTSAQGAAVLRTGVTTAPAVAATPSDSASLLSRFNDWKFFSLLKLLNRRMPNGTYGGVRGGCSNNEQPPTRLFRTLYTKLSNGGINEKFMENGVADRLCLFMRCCSSAHR